MSVSALTSALSGLWASIKSADRVVAFNCIHNALKGDWRISEFTKRILSNASDMDYLTV